MITRLLGIRKGGRFYNDELSSDLGELHRAAGAVPFLAELNGDHRQPGHKMLR